MATRFYLANAAAQAATVSPAFTGWTASGGADRRKMLTAKVASDTVTAKAISSTSGQTTAHRQYVSEPLAAGNVFTSGSTTFSAQIQGLESAVNDNIINRVRRVAIYNADGTSLLSTQIALGNATSVVEWNTARRNLTYLSATASGNTYTTGYGDRLVFEVGHNDSAGASISGSLYHGADSSLGTDLPVDETDVTTTKLPWFETSLDLVFYAHDDLLLTPATGGDLRRTL